MGTVYPRRRFLQTAATGALLAAKVTRLDAETPAEQSHTAAQGFPINGH